MGQLEKEVLVIGDIMLDRYIIGSVDRISPEAPVPIVQVTSEKSTLGGAANVASNLASLGRKVTLLGGIAKDANGTTLEKLLRDKGIKGIMVTEDFPCTITKTRVVANHQQITRIDREQELENAIPLLKAVESISFESFGIIILSDYLKGVCTKEICQTVIKAALKAGIPVIVDPKGRGWEKYEGAFLITPNMKELSDIALEKIPNQNEPICQIGESLRKRYRFDNVLVTRSERGMTLVSPANCKHFPTEAQDVFDVSGAGDTVVAVLAHELSNGEILEKSIATANKAAGYVVSKFGTYAISVEELNSL